MGRTEHEIIKSVWAEIEKATGGILNLSLIVSSSMSSQWLKPMAPSLTFVLCHVTRLISASRLKQETQIMKQNLWMFGSAAHLHTWPTFTFSLAAAYLEFRDTLVKCISRPPKQKICWEKLRTPANFRRLRWLLSSDWTAGCDLHQRNTNKPHLTSEWTWQLRRKNFNHTFYKEMDQSTTCCIVCCIVY